MQNNVISLSDKHWLYIFAGLSTKNKKYLTRYFSTVYPRSYVKELVAAIQNNDVQCKTSFYKDRLSFDKK